MAGVLVAMAGGLLDTLEGWVVKLSVMALDYDLMVARGDRLDASICDGAPMPCTRRHRADHRVLTASLSSPVGLESEV